MKPRSFARVMRLRNSTCPAASAPCRWNTCFAMSKPIVVACSMDASFGGSSTPPPWHTDAVRGRPPHHPIEPFPTDVANGRSGGMGCHRHRLIGMGKFRAARRTPRNCPAASETALDLGDSPAGLLAERERRHKAGLRSGTRADWLSSSLNFMQLDLTDEETDAL